MKVKHLVGALAVSAVMWTGVGFGAHAVLAAPEYVDPTVIAVTAPVSVPAPREDTFRPDYNSHGEWVIGDVVVTSGCPSEDSCTVEYYGGAWHVDPVVP